MIGPAIGGALIPLIGTNTIFAVNGVCFLFINLDLKQRQPPKGQAHSATENFFQSFATAVHYIRYAPGMQVILARQVLFSLLVAVVPALLPVIGLKELHVDAANLGLLYTVMGAGSLITAAFILPWGRARYSPNNLTRLAGYLLVVVIFLMAFVRQTQFLLVVAALAGVGWTSISNELWVAGQRAMPIWARGRMNASVLMFSQGAMALGGIIYGTTAQTFGVTPVLVAVAALIVVLLLTFQSLSNPLSIDFTRGLSFEPGEVTPLSPNFQVPQSSDTPVLVTIDVQLDETRARELEEFMKELRLIHLRNGADSWQLFADPARANHFHVQIMLPSWSEYLLHSERITKAEKQVIDRALSLHLGENPPETHLFIRVSKRLSQANETR
jgi:hypothetical protein